MAGKKGKSGRKPNNPVNYDAKVKKNILSAISKAKKSHNQDVWEYFIGMVYDPKVQDSVKASILKTVKEVFVTQKAESDVNVNLPSGPGILLPPAEPDPATKVD